MPAAWDSTRPYVTWAASNEGMAAHNTRRDKSETSKVGSRSLPPVSTLSNHSSNPPTSRPASPPLPSAP